MEFRQTGSHGSRVILAVGILVLLVLLLPGRARAATEGQAGTVSGGAKPIQIMDPFAFKVVRVRARTAPSMSAEARVAPRAGVGRTSLVDIPPRPNVRSPYTPPVTALRR